jgi:phage terminase small subunit
MPAKKAASNTERAPSHLNATAKKVYSETVQSMKELGTYHITDNLLIEQLAVLVSQSRVLQRAVDTGPSADITKDLTLINTFSGQISRLTNRLGIAQDSRPSDRPLGRPTKQSGLTVDEDDAAAWSNVLPIGGE